MFFGVSFFSMLNSLENIFLEQHFAALGAVQC